MAVDTKLWTLTTAGRPHIDADELAAAVEDQVARQDLDYRSRVLIRDSVNALRHFWGDRRVAKWLAGSPHGQVIEAICRGPWDDDRGFSSLMRRVMDVTEPETIRQFLRELGLHLRHPLRIHVGGGAALILPGYVRRKTEDVDVVDEVPAEFRSQHQLLEDLHRRYGLELTHFQRHYLPMGWEQRLHSQPPYGRMEVFLVDVYDVFLSKLFSNRTKDIDDLRVLAPQLDKEVLARKLKETVASMLAAPELRERAGKNWYILYGESLPS